MLLMLIIANVFGETGAVLFL